MSNIISDGKIRTKVILRRNLDFGKDLFGKDFGSFGSFLERISTIFHLCVN